MERKKSFVVLTKQQKMKSSTWKKKICIIFQKTTKIEV
jgi:hypothetical protein